MKKIISHVVALSNNNVIGVDNMLPWNLKRDLQHFKNYTTNKILLMGRKTYESIGRPLPNRINYVISTTIDEIDGAEVFKSIDDAIDAANKRNCKRYRGKFDCDKCIGKRCASQGSKSG